MITNTENKKKWCTLEGVPKVLIDTLCLVRSIQNAQLYAFCILPTHMHIILCPGKKGLSSFMQSFKTNSSKNVKNILSASSLFSGWRDGFFDEHIQTGKQLGAAISYVQRNAAKHRIVTNMMEWPWTSINFPTLLDPIEMWLD
ncbi:hypothetical protein A3A67_01935 [Candidatus Peribacteria bacterium RIFCSPLOWO2_01_FULL_51_18]|nr:MAG: hypothetical protein A3C52_02435 [Candidatus Peribacteria bacterium RIFCSPHIGHO2_02_FULL_51_15]OGJ65583.1 MAG: hypothetical protein A3A67_01935 [Candidatus Peribacteria bacterium RIFCSPLOWO2_01_FULL_51_18]OGJ68380.1 MAG: hypothetical protein A3J34_00170 [Candidatus Peribacteria bacterium RIFCSPLOWO2_02_FULL_51_10]